MRPLKTAWLLLAGRVTSCTFVIRVSSRSCNRAVEHGPSRNQPPEGSWLRGDRTRVLHFVDGFISYLFRGVVNVNFG